MIQGVATRFVLVAALTMGIFSPASADWQHAQSEHFAIYADTRADDLKRFAELLERYHKAMEVFTGRDVGTPSPSNRVTIYMVGSDENLRDLHGSRRSNVAGFYISRAGGSVAFVPNIRIAKSESDFSLAVLLHEYAHHFLLSSSRQTVPGWVSEGSAEFFGSTNFASNGNVEIGRPPYYRSNELAHLREVSASELLDPELYEKKHGKGLATFYASSWGLFHFLTFAPERKGQLALYLRALAGGMPATQAARSAFGDIDQLDRDLKTYLTKRRFKGSILEPRSIPIGEVSVRELSEATGAIMPVIVQSKRGVDSKQALELLPQAREIAARYPNEAGVLAALAEAEFDAGNDQPAIAAADAAIAIDPAAKNAYVQKGYALFRIAEAADDRDAAYTAAMQPFLALNALENDHPLPLIYMYRSYMKRGATPSESARHALERASELAPFDHDLAMEVALMQAAEGKLRIASSVLGPVAANPHGGKRAELARALIDEMAKAQDGKPFDPSPVIARLGDAEEEADTDED